MRNHARIPRDAVEQLLLIAARSPEIAAFQFAVLDFAPLADARSCLSTLDNLSVAGALELRDKLRLPFWTGAMLAASKSCRVPKGILAAATYHQKLAGKLEWIATKKLALEDLDRMSQEAYNRKQLPAITSMVKMQDESIKHLPLLDFHTGYSEYATSLIVEILRLIGVTGTLLKSGKSYHFYGDSPIDLDELRVFLGKALLFDPIVDRAWIAHQLIEGCCALRISAREEYGGAPITICQVR